MTADKPDESAPRDKQTSNNEHASTIKPADVAFSGALPKLGGTVTGRVKARWGSSATYQSATPARVRLPDGALIVDRSQRGQVRTLSNTAVHPDEQGSLSPEIQYRRYVPGMRVTAEAKDHLTPAQRKQRLASQSHPSQPLFSRWSVMALLIALIVCLPILSVIWLAFNPEENIWPHLLATVLESYILTTLGCLLYTSPSPRDRTRSRMPSSA